MPKGIYSKEKRKGMFQKGHKMSPELKSKLKKVNEGRKGETAANWRGGISRMSVRIRNSKEGVLWRRSVLERDKKCIWCGSTEKLEVDHIKPFSIFPELRFAIDNGRTLCRKCHLTTETWGGRIQ